MSSGAAALPPKLTTPSTLIAQRKIPHCCNSYLDRPQSTCAYDKMAACQILLLNQTTNNNPGRIFSKFIAIQALRGPRHTRSYRTKQKINKAGSSLQVMLLNPETHHQTSRACLRWGELHLQSAMSRFGISAAHLSPAQGIHDIAPAD